MVNSCVCAGCTNSGLSGHRVHRFPSRKSTIFSHWVRFVQVKRAGFSAASVNKHTVVCGDHFTLESYQPGDMLECRMGFRSKLRVRLMTNAVPSVQKESRRPPPSKKCLALPETVAGGGTGPLTVKIRTGPSASSPNVSTSARQRKQAVRRENDTDLKESEPTAIPPSTQRKTSHRRRRSRGSHPPSTVTLTVSSPDQTSLPSTYIARSAVWTLKEPTFQDPDSMMSEMCNIQGCNGTEELLSFPKDPSTLQQWMLCLGGRLKHPANSSSKVCSAHFTPDSVINCQEKKSGVAENLILKTGVLPSHFTEVHNEQVEPCPQERTSDGDQWDLQQTWPTEDTRVSESTPPHTHSKGTYRNSSNMQGRSALMLDIVVNLACLLQLFQKCLKCCSDACSVSVRRKGPIIHVVQRCWSCGNSREWTNQQQSIKPSVQLLPDLKDSLEAKEEPVVTSEDMEGEITIKIEEEVEEKELEEEAVDEAEEEEDKVMEEDHEEAELDEEEEAEMEKDAVDEADTEEVDNMTEEKKEEVEMEEGEEEDDEVTEEEEEEEEEENQKPKKRKRRDSDEDWTPNDKVIMGTSDEESEAEQEKEEVEERRPHRWTWCSDCGVKASIGCSREKHLLLYCCKWCGYREGCQEPKNSELLETQRVSSPETPSAGHQEGIIDVGQSAENSCSPEDDGNNNKSTDSSNCGGTEEPLDSDVDTSTFSRYDCSKRKMDTNKDVRASMAESNNVIQRTSLMNQDKQNLPVYGVYFTDLCGLQRHMKHSHSGKRHLCPDCGLFCNIRDGKTSHVCDLKVRPFSCLICGRRFKYEARLKLHIQFHNEDYTTKCQYCYEAFKQKEDKERHEETHIGENLKFRCPECPKRFSTICTRKAHISTTHLKCGRFVCKVCDKGFHFESNLKRHEMVHTGVKPYTCKICNHFFNQPGHLKSHMRVHTGERPFMCHECGQCFNHNVSLKNHVQRKHRSAPDDDVGYREKGLME